MVHKRSCYSTGGLYCAGDYCRVFLYRSYCCGFTRRCQFDIETDSCYPDPPHKYHHAGAFHFSHKRIPFLVCRDHRQRFCGQRVYGGSLGRAYRFNRELSGE